MKIVMVVTSAALLMLVAATPFAGTVVALVGLAEANPAEPAGVAGLSALGGLAGLGALVPGRPAVSPSGPAGLVIPPSSDVALPVTTSSAARPAVEYALAQIGTPYRWGGEAPGVGFDCSGLVQAAWAAAGVNLPRVAQDQFDAGPLLPSGSLLSPGDLVFFGPEGGGVTHVGLVVDPSGQMVDAPHTGAFVRLEPFPVTVGARWGDDIYLGATRPGRT